MEMNLAIYSLDRCTMNVTQADQNQRWNAKLKKLIVCRNNLLKYGPISHELVSRWKNGRLWGDAILGPVICTLINPGIWNRESLSKTEPAFGINYTEITRIERLPQYINLKLNSSMNNPSMYPYFFIALSLTHLCIFSNFEINLNVKCC